MLATPRRLLLALVALAACTPDLIAGVVCIKNGNGSWTCSGDGQFDPDQDPYVVTNILGVCTNCVSMSPSECESIKNGINEQVRDIKSEVDTSVDNIRSVKSVKTDIEDRINAFRDDYMSAMHWYEMEWLEEGYDEELYYPVQGSLDDLDYYADAVETSLVSLGASADSIGGFVNSINCSTCTASWGGDTPSGGGGGGGGGSGSDPSSCPDCPCKEQMEALHDLLKDDFLPRIKKIDTNVAQLTNLIGIARDQLRVTKDGFHNVTNLFNRLDDYVLDDFSNRVYQIRYDVSFIASNLAQKVQRILIDQSYSNAQFYVRQDSDTPIEMADLDETLIPEGDVSKFDWGEFENLPWFTRVEYLLLKLNGVYVTTNNNANAGVSKAEENQKAIEDDFSDFKSSVNGDIKTGFTQVGTSISTFFSSFNSAVSTRGDKVVEIQLMSNFIGEEPLMLNIDPDVADACRTISSLLWTVLFGFLLYKIMIYFWVVFVDTINWWVNQTQGFVK